MYEPQTDVYISNWDKQTKSVILRHQFIQGTAFSEEKTTCSINQLKGRIMIRVYDV